MRLKYIVTCQWNIFSSQQFEDAVNYSQKAISLRPLEEDIVV